MRQHLRHIGIAGAALIGVALATPAAAGGDEEAAPDFSGPWVRNVFNFEQPDSGPGPIVNLMRLGKNAGVSVVDGDPIPLMGDYNNPILKPEAAATVRKNGEYSQSGHNFADPSNQCGVYAPPYIFAIVGGLQMLRYHDEIVIFQQQDDQMRHVRLNGKHPKNVKPSTQGDSVAHYEGDTLVIDTVAIKPMPYTVVDRFGTPQSEAMHVVERYRLIDAKQAKAALDHDASIVGTTGPLAYDEKAEKALRVEITVDDPKVFTTPWKANATYMHVNRPWAEGVCADNNFDILNQGDTKYLPTAGKPDF